MSKVESEFAIKNIIFEVIQHCDINGEIISDSFVAYILKGALLCPDNDLKINQQITKEESNNLIQICIDKINNKMIPSNDTLHLQVYFDENFITRSEIVKEHEEQMMLQLKAVSDEICDHKPKSSSEFDQIYNTIVSYITARSNLGSPTDVVVYREVNVALKSIFPISDLPNFISLSRKDKERELRELTMIVSGIRLYNKNIGKGGESILDLVGILNTIIPSASQIVEKEIIKNKKRVDRLIAVAEKFQIERIITEKFSEEILKQSIINSRQMIAFLEIIDGKIIDSAKRVELSINQLASRLKQMKERIATKSTIPTAQVYPQFMHLAQLWKTFQEEIICIDVYNKIVEEILQYTQIQYKCVPEEELDYFIEGVEVLSDVMRKELYFINYHTHTSNSSRRIQCEKSQDIQVLYEESTKNYNKLILEFMGFCCHTMVSNDRLLVYGNTNLGVVMYKRKCYAFASVKAAEDFIIDPELYVREVIFCAKRSIELIQLLNLHEYFEALLPSEKEASKSTPVENEKVVIKQDFGTQTDTHFIESNIIKSYQWNEWEMRRVALKLANLRNKVTHSSQTAMTFAKRDISTQVYLAKKAETQTNSDKATNVPKPQIFLTGLRGSNNTKYKKVDLTLDACEN